jgi:short-subunit dehydrogenase
MGEVCAVVGVGPGIGLAVARRFAREGFAAGLVARRADALAGYASAVQALGVRACAVGADVDDAPALRAALARIADALGPPSVLVYNASSSRRGEPTVLALDDLLADLRVCVGGALVAAQAVVAAMRERGRGTILLTGGGLALRPRAAVASLSVGKAALRNLTFSLAQELGSAGIHVATVTVDGYVRAGTAFDADAVAEAYWRLHVQPPEAWETEVVLRPPDGGTGGRGAA